MRINGVGLIRREVPEHERRLPWENLLGNAAGGHRGTAATSGADLDYSQGMSHKANAGRVGWVPRPSYTNQTIKPASVVATAPPMGAGELVSRNVGYTTRVVPNT